MKDSSVAYVNEYIKEHKGGLAHVRCEVFEAKGRCLVATKRILAGQVIFKEKALCRIAADPGAQLYKDLKKWHAAEDFDYDVLWYWCALCCLMTLEEAEEMNEILDGLSHKTPQERHLAVVLQALLELPLPKIREGVRDKLRMFFAPPKMAVSEASRFISAKMNERIKLDPSLIPRGHNRKHDRAWTFVEELFDAHVIERTLTIWMLNCFEGDDEGDTYVTFFLPTFSSHSCLPNALWHFDDDMNFVLVARLMIEKGEELSLSYLNDEDLLAPTTQRVQDLQDTKYFTCTCPRCSLAADLSLGFSCTECDRGMYFLPTRGLSKRKGKAPPIHRATSIHHTAQTIIELNKLAAIVPLNWDWTEWSDAEISKKLTVAQISKQLQAIHPLVCTECGADAAEDDALQLLHFVNELWELVDPSDVRGGDHYEIPSVEKGPGERMRQHYYLGNMAEVCSQIIKHDSPQLAAELNKVRLRMSAAMYPAPCGQHGWVALEIIEMSLLKYGIRNEDNLFTIGSFDSSQLEGLLADTDVLPVGTYMLKTFRLLFTTEHDFFNTNYDFLMGLLNALVPFAKKNKKHNDLINKWIKTFKDIKGVK